MEHLKQIIREVPDFPKPGILFYDITTLLKDAAGFKAVIDALQAHYRTTRVDLVLGIEARGFIFAPTLAYALGAGFIPVRKPKKLPAEDGPGDVSARVRHRLSRSPCGRHSAGPERPHRGRPAGHRRHGGGRRHGWWRSWEARWRAWVLWWSLTFSMAAISCRATTCSPCCTTTNERQHPAGRPWMRSRRSTWGSRSSISGPTATTSCARFSRRSRWPTRWRSSSCRLAAPKLELESDLDIPDNLIVRAARLAMDAMRCTGRVRFRLRKRIPMGAGLGGGSSDAAAVLLALPALAGRRIPHGCADPAGAANWAATCRSSCWEGPRSASGGAARCIHCRTRRVREACWWLRPSTFRPPRPTARWAGG